MTKLVGILNVTPDSFSDGGLYTNPQKAIERAVQLFKDGADIIDIGSESTRPNAPAISFREEWSRLEHILPKLLETYPGMISLDTYHPETVLRALDLGEVIINDVTGMQNPKMVEIVAKYKPICIVCELPATDVQKAHSGELLNDIEKVKRDLLLKRSELITRGLNKKDIILDPGIGFGKTPELNRKLLRFAEEIPDSPVMIGYSKKRFLGEHRMKLETNLKAGKIAIKSGAAFLRVHDVEGHRQLLY